MSGKNFSKYCGLDYSVTAWGCPRGSAMIKAKLFLLYVSAVGYFAEECGDYELEAEEGGGRGGRGRRRWWQRRQSGVASSVLRTSVLEETTKRAAQACLPKNNQHSLIAYTLATGATTSLLVVALHSSKKSSSSTASHFLAGSLQLRSWLMHDLTIWVYLGVL